MIPILGRVLTFTWCFSGNQQFHCF